MISDVAFFSEKGIREINQDAIYVSADKHKGIFVVADGMGGHFGGEYASRMIVSEIQKWWSHIALVSTDIGINEVSKSCHQLLKDINENLFAYFTSKNEVGGSTAVILIVWEKKYVVFSVGDSRLYHAKNGMIEQLTIDDVWENIPEIKYGMNIQQKKADMRFGMLTEAVGSANRLQIKRLDGLLIGKEIFFLCSDGVHKFCSSNELEKILCRRTFFINAEKIKKRIINRICKGVTDDNYSAIVCITNY